MADGCRTIIKHPRAIATRPELSIPQHTTRSEQASDLPDAVYGFFDRKCGEFESRLNHRKQTVGCCSNRHWIAVRSSDPLRNFAAPPRLADSFEFPASNSVFQAFARNQSRSKLSGRSNPNDVRFSPGPNALSAHRKEPFS